MIRPINLLYPLETTPVSGELNSDLLPQEQFQNFRICQRYVEFSEISWEHVEIVRSMQNILELSRTLKGTLKNIPEHMRIIMNIHEHYMDYSEN